MTKKKELSLIEKFIAEVAKEADDLINEYNDKHQELNDLWIRILMLSGKQEGLIEHKEKTESLERTK